MVRRGVGKQGGGKGLVGERGEGGGVCVARVLPKPVTLKRRSLKVARLQVSQLVGLIHCPWLGCLYVFIVGFVLCLTPADAGSVLLHTATSSHGRPILWTAILLGCSYTPG